MGKQALVIGGGFGGLSAAALFARDGYRVTVVEKNAQLGGRARYWHKDGCTFLVAMFLDIVGVIIAFDCWTRVKGDITLQNYIAWFCIAFVFAKQKLPAANKVPTLFVVLQFFFFAGLRIFTL